MLQVSRSFPRHNYFYLNPLDKNRPSWLNLNWFNVIVIHYSVYLLGYGYLNETWREAIADSKGVRVLFIQDEYRRVNDFIDRMRELKINILFTCYPESEIEKIYTLEKLPDVIKVPNLTGYVPGYLEQGLPDLSLPRPIDVGYRARGTGFWWLGELYQEKQRIGVEFLKHVNGKGIKCDISSEERDRIYGTKWIEFLKTCRCFLGTESGASVVDFTGKIEKRVKEYCAGHPMATFAEVKELFFKDVDGLIRMNQISPRIFESIGCGCCPVLFEGEYSGILRPEEHYIPIKKDFSNIDEVIDKILDQSLVTGTVRRAYDEVIASDKYSYRSFVKSVDRTIEEFISSRIDTPSPCRRLASERPKSNKALLVTLVVPLRHFGCPFLRSERVWQTSNSCSFTPVLGEGKILSRIEFNPSVNSIMYRVRGTVICVA